MGDTTDSDDFELEPNQELGDVAGANAKIQALRVQLKEAQQNRDEYLDGWQRCKADTVNGRKDALAEADRRISRVREAFVEELIPALDSFDMALGAKGMEGAPESWKSGMERVRNQLIEVLSKGGMQRFGAVGESFDPRLHEALDEEKDAEGEPHTIFKVLRFGYRLDQKVIRPAQVIIIAPRDI